MSGERPLYFCLKIRSCVRCRRCEPPVHRVQLQTHPARAELTGSEIPGQPGRCRVGSTLLRAAVSLRLFLQGRMGRSGSAPFPDPGCSGVRALPRVSVFCLFLFLSPPNPLVWTGEEGVIAPARCAALPGAQRPGTQRQEIPSAEPASHTHVTSSHRHIALSSPGASKTVLAAGVTLQSAESYFKALPQWGLIFFFFLVGFFCACLCLEP